MKKITAFEKIICRTPAFTVNHQMHEIWDELKSKIEESSPAFFDIIKDVKADEHHLLDEKTRFTLWKYLNRAKYRSTPFGSFAAISLLSLSKYSLENIQLNAEMKLHHMLDWSHQATVLTSDLSKINSFLSNSTIYITIKEIRYIHRKNGAFELAAVEALPELCSILSFCKRKSNLTELIDLMKHNFNFDGQSTKALLLQMIELQLLFTDQHPNIIGTDYFERLGIDTKPKASNYIMAERKIGKGNFNTNLLKNVPNLIHQLQQVLPEPKNHHLESFKRSFLKRFEQSQISLAIAIDPELGIGYGNLEQPSSMDPLVTEIELKAGAERTEQIQYGPLQQFLLRKIIDGLPIDLADYQSKTEVSSILPNTLSVMFNVYNDNLVLASVGGNSANMLLGRFTHCGDEWEKYGLEIANLEEEVNKDIEFFDIAYQAEKKIDNVNRRKKLYSNELPLLSWSCAEAPIDLEDILVSVESEQVVLRSKKTGKRLIPRLASAYNYTRSDLAVYRFLCDVQTQGLSVNLNFNLSTFFPHLNHYPRVSYKNIIVERASWLIPVLALKSRESLLAWMDESKVSSQLIVGDSDQSLYFDLTEEESIWALLRYGKLQKCDFYLREALISTNDLIKDENGSGYHPQYIVNYHHKEQIYHNKEITYYNNIQNFHPPCAKWLYVELYSHTSSTNQTLMLLAEWIKSKKRQLIKWFFIRYTDPSPHVRLRLRLKNETLGYSLIYDLYSLLEVEMRYGFINDVQVKSYRPEINRYGAKRMAIVEDFFWNDSVYVIWLLKKSKDEMTLKATALHTIYTMCKQAYPNVEDQIRFAKIMASNFAKEMKLEAGDFKKINTSYSEFKSLFTPNFKVPLALNHKRNKLLFNLFTGCESVEVKQNLLADLIHMHVNRLFRDAQRIHEAILYQYLAKMLQAEFSLTKGKLGL